MRNIQEAVVGEQENADEERLRREKAETEAAVVTRHKHELLQVIAQAKK